MDSFKNLIDSVSTVGFPIVLCFVLIYVLFKQINELKDTINNNTIALTKLVTKLEEDKQDDNKD